MSDDQQNSSAETLRSDLMKELAWDEIYRRSGIVQKEPIDAWSVYLELLGERRTAPLKVLDAGCGTGRHTLAALAALPRSEVTAFDNSTRSIELLRSATKDCSASGRLRALVLDMDKECGFEPHSFDLVISTLVIHHGYWREIAARMLLLSTLLKEGGYLIFAGLSDRDPRVHTGYEVEPGTRLDTDQEDGALPHHFISAEEMDTLFQSLRVHHRVLVRRPMVTAKGQAAHWEVVARR